MPHLIPLVILGGIPVEHEHQRTALKHKNLLLLVHVRHPLVPVTQKVEPEDDRWTWSETKRPVLTTPPSPVVKLHHGPVKISQLLVPKMVHVGQAPLPVHYGQGKRRVLGDQPAMLVLHRPACMVVRPRVPLPWEVYPLGVAELVAHEAQVALAP